MIAGARVAPPASPCPGGATVEGSGDTKASAGGFAAVLAKEHAPAPASTTPGSEDAVPEEDAKVDPDAAWLALATAFWLAPQSTPTPTPSDAPAPGDAPGSSEMGSASAKLPTPNVSALTVPTAGQATETETPADATPEAAAAPADSGVFVVARALGPSDPFALPATAAAATATPPPASATNGAASSLTAKPSPKPDSKPDSKPAAAPSAASPRGTVDLPKPGATPGALPAQAPTPRATPIAQRAVALARAAMAPRTAAPTTASAAAPPTGATPPTTASAPAALAAASVAASSLAAGTAPPSSSSPAASLAATPLGPPPAAPGTKPVAALRPPRTTSASAPTTSPAAPALAPADLPFALDRDEEEALASPAPHLGLTAKPEGPAKPATEAPAKAGEPNLTEAHGLARTARHEAFVHASSVMSLRRGATGELRLPELGLVSVSATPHAHGPLAVQVDAARPTTAALLVEHHAAMTEAVREVAGGAEVNVGHHGFGDRRHTPHEAAEREDSPAPRRVAGVARKSRFVL